MMNHEDSMFSAPSETFGNRGNPFLGEGKQSLIKKINTEAYLKQDPNGMALYTQGRQ